MRIRQLPRADLAGFARTFVPALAVGFLLVAIAREIVATQTAALAQCAPNCQVGGPVFPTPWGDPWYYIGLLVPLGLILFATYATPKLAALRSHGD